MNPRAQITAIALLLCMASRATARSPQEKPHYGTSAASTEPQAQAQDPGSESLKDKMIGLLPDAVSSGLEIDLWGWLGYLKNNQEEYDHYYDAELSLAITKSFEQRVAISGQVNYINANGEERVELEQLYVSSLLSEKDQSILTIGKFNANFGVEGRDFWSRKTGTTSLLFGAQPQDIVGGMLTLPLGDTGIKLKPFLSADFQGQFTFDQKVSFGMMTEYHPSSEWSFGLTGWIGPGVVLYGGRPLRSPYSRDAYGNADDYDPEEINAGGVIENWQGPNLVAEKAGTLYFLDAKAVWKARPDLTLSAEYLFGTTKTSDDRFGWHGWMVLGVYDVSDRLHIYGRFSYLDDSDWLITGIFTTSREVSAGFGYELFHGVEFRAEYRHDFSNAYPDIDSVSVHLTFTY